MDDEENASGISQRGTRGRWVIAISLIAAVTGLIAALAQLIAALKV